MKNIREKATIQAIVPAKKYFVFKRFFILLLLFSFSTAFSFAVGGDQRNYILIGIMSVSCLLFLCTFSMQINFNELYVYGFFLSLLLCLVKYPETFRGSTLAYSLMFALTFIVYLRLLRSRALPYSSYLKMLKFILYAYFWVLLIQQFCVVAHLPIFNFILGDTRQLKLNALSPEPSHSALIVTILFYSFICMRALELQRSYRLFSDGFSDRWVWFCFLYTMLTMGSASAYFFLPLQLIQFVSIQTLFWGGGATLVLLLFQFQGVNIIALNRTLAFGSALLSNSPYQMLDADHSAAMRVLPVYYYLEKAQLLSFDFWFGKGIDYNINFFTNLIPGVSVGHSLGGLFPSLFLNHGMVAAILLMVMVYKNCLSKFWSFSTLLCALLIFTCPLNTQITWLIFLLLASNRFFLRQQAGVSGK